MSPSLYSEYKMSFNCIKIQEIFKLFRLKKGKNLMQLSILHSDKCECLKKKSHGCYY